jgi:hypothetical protein
LKNLSLSALLAVLAVYGAVWPHELGHAAAAWGLGCKADPWRTGTAPLLWGSGGGAIDEACLASRGPVATAAVAGAGIAVNLLLLIVLALALRSAGGWLSVFFLLLALANAAEAFSYLLGSTLWPRADMRLVVAAVGGRWAWFSLGVLGAILTVAALSRPVRAASAALASPRLPARRVQLFFGLYAALVTVAATVERIFVG